MERKLENLEGILKEMRSLLIAFSGGVDSTFLVKVAHQILGDKVLAVTATSPTYPVSELSEAKRLASQIGVEHVVIDSEELENEDFLSNSPRRCYFCKKELYSKLLDIAEREKIKWVADGSNCDDEDDFRPGREAVKEMGIRSPLLEANLTKVEIRRLSRKMRLPTWDKPADACLASRFPYGDRITPDKLRKVDKAEEFLRRLGFRQVRLRHHDSLARIEVDRAEIGLLLDKEKREKVINYLKGLGYHYVTVDLEGYRTGSLNEPLN
ncbi:ATP-dependent sacrificial sulfur transferase LarE [bacterium]|nr:ATP-dependent sacrificial sulfur transferase LarE [bacterium]